MSAEEAWRVRIRDAAGRSWGAGVLIAGRYVLTAAHVVAAALGVGEGGDRPAGRVRFDLPMRRDLGDRYAEIVWWVPVREDRSGDLAGLSVVGPALQGVGEPVFGRIESVTGQTVRLHGYPENRKFPDGLTARARVVGYGASELVQLNRVGEVELPAGGGHSGAAVIEESSGKVLGIARAAAGMKEERVVWMSPMDKVAPQWSFLADLWRLQESPVLRAAFARAREWLPGHRSPAREDLLSCLRPAMEVPDLAEPRSRHSIISELPLNVSLTAPRSANDRTDVAALLWTCARTREVPRLRDRLRAMEQTPPVRDLIRELEKLER